VEPLTIARGNDITTTRIYEYTTLGIMMEKIRSHKNLHVYQLAYDASLEIHEMTKSFPLEEKYSLTDQIRRSSRSVCANIAEAYRKRRYPKHFVLKLNDSEGEASEPQFWIDFSFYQFLENKLESFILISYIYYCKKTFFIP
jgi:four helix bundle protein